MLSSKNNSFRLVISATVVLCLCTVNGVSLIVDVKKPLRCGMILTLSGQGKKKAKQFKEKESMILDLNTSVRNVIENPGIDKLLKR